MLWDVLLTRMMEFPTSVVNDENLSYTYSEIILQVEKLSDIISNISPSVSKCAVLCKSELNTGLTILSCYNASVTVIPLSIKYGEKHCKKIMELTLPSIVIIDDYNDFMFLNEYNCGILNINGELIKKTEYCISELELSDVAMIMCTSGTTGTPKGAMITENNLLSNLNDIEKYFEIYSSDNILICRPLYHCAVLTGEFLISLIKGLNIIFYNGQFSPIILIDQIRRNNITVICGTPTLFYYLCNFAMRQVEALPLRTIAISGECITGVVANSIRKALPEVKVYSVYGLTEASPRVTFLSPNLFDTYPLSIGTPLASITAKIVGEKCYELPQNCDGELVVWGNNIMKGYYKNIELTSKAIINGWLYTGDIACMDKDGLIYIKSRKDNMIIRAGVNIYPQEIENALKADDNICEVLAYGVKDDNVGQKICLRVVTSEKNTKEKVFQICNSLLPIFQLPDIIELCSELPKNGSGKLVRSGAAHD